MIAHVSHTCKMILQEKDMHTGWYMGMARCLVLTLVFLVTFVSCRRDLLLRETEKDSLIYSQYDTPLENDMIVEKTRGDFENEVAYRDTFFEWTLCGEEDRVGNTVGTKASAFEVVKVTLEPERITRGTTAIFSIDTRVIDPLWTESDGNNSVVDMAVWLGGVQVFTEQDNLCDVSACPIPGHESIFHITYARKFPVYTPPGRYHMVMQGNNGDIGAQLFCIEIAFTVHFF